MNYFCTQCGTKVIDEESLFCHRCGAALPHAFDFEETPFQETPVIIPELDTDDEETAAEESQADFGNRKISESVNVSANEKNSENVNVPKVKPPVVTPDKPIKIKEGNPLAAALVSMLLSIILFIAATAGQLWYVLQRGINNHTVKTAVRIVVDDVDFTKMNVPGFVNDRDVAIPGVAPQTALPDAIYGTIDDYYKEIFGVEQDHIRAMLESEIFREFFADIIDGGIDYIMGKDGTSEGIEGIIVTSDRITELIRQNSEQIEAVTSYELVESDFDDIKKVLSNSGLDDLTWGSWVSVTGNTRDAVLIRGIFRIVEQQPLLSLGCIIAAFVIPVALLIVIHRRKVSRTLLYLGIPCILSGGIFIAGRLIGIEMLFRWAERRLGISSEAVNTVKDVLSDAGDAVLYSGIAVAAIGLIAVTVKIIVKAVKN